MKRRAPHGCEEGVEMKKKVMCISYQFPPFSGTGVFRLLNFMEHLPAFGWESVVLSVLPEHYETGTPLDASLADRVGQGVRVRKTKCFQGIEAMLSLRDRLRTWGPRGPEATEAPMARPVSAPGMWQGF